MATPQVIKKVTGKLPFMKKEQVITRRHKRYECVIVGELLLLERGMTLDGAVMEVSLGGLLFRCASLYQLDRTGEEAIVTFEGVQIAGKIMASRPIGYGMKLHEDLDLTLVQSLVDTYGYDDLNSE